jgi:uncharacterized membrane protein
MASVERLVPPRDRIETAAVEAPATGSRPKLAALSRSSAATRVVAATTCVYALVAAAAGLLHYRAFQEARFDLGNMTQAIWTTAHGHFLETTTLVGNQVSRLAFHVDPILVLFAPVWWVWSSPAILLVVQSLAVAAGAFPVFWLARKHLESERAAAQFAFAYLLYPATLFNAFTTLSSFHPVSLAIPLVLYAIWYLDEDRLLPFAVFAVLAAATKEEIPLAVGCLGLWYAQSKRRPLAGLTIFGVGATVTLLNFFVVIPHYSSAAVNPFRGRYEAVGGTPTGMLHTAVTDPGAIVHQALTGHKLVYVALLLVPFLGLWAFEPLLLLGAAPDLAINLLSSKANQTQIVFHWTAGIVPFVVAASVLGARRFRDVDRTSLHALAAVISVAIWSVIVLAHFEQKGLAQVSQSSPTRQAKTEALALIPANATVAATNQLAGYLSNRRRILTFPYVREARWLIVDANDDTRPGYRDGIAKLRRDPRWRQVFGANGISVFRRVR